MKARFRLWLASRPSFRERLCASLAHPRWTRQNGSIWCYSCGRTIRRATGEG